VEQSNDNRNCASLPDSNHNLHRNRNCKYGRKRNRFSDGNGKSRAYRDDYG
jgi:hypothetical protein